MVSQLPCIYNVLPKSHATVAKKKKNHLLDLEKGVLLNIGIQLPKFSP